jgi:hypothetical protein
MENLHFVHRMFPALEYHYPGICQKLSKEVGWKIRPNKHWLPLLPIAILLFTFTSQAQSRFEKTYGTTKNEYGRSAIYTSNQNLALTGYAIKNATNKDIYFLRLDTCGREKISRTYGGILDDIGNSIIENTNGNIVVAGNTRNFGSPGTNAYFMKLSGPSYGTVMGRSIGDTLEDFGEFVQQTSDLGYIVVGSTSSKGAGGSDVMLIKLNALGSLSWSKTYGGLQDDFGYAVRQVSTGYIIAGTTKSFGLGNSDAYVIKTDLNGNITWSRAFGNTGIDAAYDIRQTLDGGFIVGGKTRNSNPLGNSQDDVLLLKISSGGVLLWSKSYGGLQDDVGESVLQLYDSSYVIAGYTKSYGKGNWDVYLFKVNKNGVTQWARTYGGGGEDKAYSLAAVPYDAGFLLCGHTNSFGAGGFDAYLIKTDKQGFSGCNDTSAISVWSPIDSTKSGAVVDSGLKALSGAHADTLQTIDSVVCSSCSPPLAPDKLFDEAISSYSIYPTPASDFLVIKSGADVMPFSVAIYNEWGICIFHSVADASSNNIRISTINFVPGVYFVKIANSKTCLSEKILVVR